MDTMITISTWTGIVQYFLTIFTTPTAELFTRLVTGWVLCTAKRTITRILPFAAPQGQRTHDAYHRFFPDASAVRRPPPTGQQASCGLEYRGYIQEHKAVSRWPAAPDLEGQRPRTNCCCESVALFGGVALVSAAEEGQQNFCGSSLVSWQNLPELSGCFGLSSTRALETEN